MKYILTKPKIILLVGMMGAGKSSLGRLLSKRLDLPFFDSDAEIEKSTGFLITELFAKYGVNEFRLGEERVMKRLLLNGPCVLSSGGDAFLSDKTRELAQQNAISVWLKASPDVIAHRTTGRHHRPLVPAVDNFEKVMHLLDERSPFYQQADIIVDSFKEPPVHTALRVMYKLQEMGVVQSREYTPEEIKKFAFLHAKKHMPKRRKRYVKRAF